jgi:RNA polymerase sigma-54 factor
MSSFFAREVCGETSGEILQVILSIISGEDPKRPLSDSAICQLLSSRGYDIARRTVAKYRDMANIPPATGRKQR